jgi:hypothetical protein
MVIARQNTSSSKSSSTEDVGDYSDLLGERQKTGYSAYTEKPKHGGHAPKGKELLAIERRIK